MVTQPKADEGASARRRSLSREVVVAAAVEMADRDGIEAVTMRKLAAELGVGAMSLYRHTTDRDDLLVAMTERVTAQFPMTTGAADGWRALLRDLAEVEWRCYRSHPWLREVRAQQLPLDSASREQFAHIMGLLADTGADPQECYSAVLAVGSLVFGAAALTIAPGPRDARPTASGDRLQGVEPALAASIETSPHAALQRALGRLLDGYAPVFDS